MPNKTGNFKASQFARVLPRPYLGGCSLFERTCQYGYRSKGAGYLLVKQEEWGKGCSDNRRVDWRIYEDYRLQTVEDRLGSYRRNQHRIPMEWYEQEADRVLRLSMLMGMGHPISTWFSMIVARKLRTALDFPCWRKRMQFILPVFLPYEN